MGFLSGLLILPFVASAGTVISMRRAILERQWKTGNSILELVARDAAEYHALPVYSRLDAIETVHTDAGADLAVRDSTLMELAYLGGGVDPREIGIEEFREFVARHERLRRDAAAVEEFAEKLSPPRVWERLTGRETFATLGQVALKFAGELRLIRGYWAEMAVRASGRLRDDAMVLELERLALELRALVNRLVESATNRERLGPRFHFRELQSLAQDLNFERHLRNCQKLMRGYVRRARREHAETLRAGCRALDVAERRRGFYLVPSD